MTVAKEHDDVLQFQDVDQSRQFSGVRAALTVVVFMKVVSLPYQKLQFLNIFAFSHFWYRYLIDKVVSLSDCFLGAEGNYHLDNFIYFY